jgi:uncharacterized YccA/Bax inhibitor family protein
MSVRGVIGKSLLLFALLLMAFGLVWDQVAAHPAQVFGVKTTWVMIGAAIIGLLAALCGGFLHRTAVIAAPIYALAQGVFLAIISWQYQQMYHGLPLLAAGFTITTLGGMLLLYNLKIVRASPMFIMVIVGSTVGLMLGIGLLALLNMFGIAQGATAALYGNGPIGIGFSILCVGLASFNLIINFHVIDEGERGRLPRHMEWVASLGLMTTLVWLYIEILQLLAKLRR